MFRRFAALVAALTLASGTLMVQTAGPVAPRVRVTTLGRHLNGRLIRADADTVTLVPDGNQRMPTNPVRIPLSLISAAAVSQGQRSRFVEYLATLAGAGTMWTMSRVSHKPVLSSWGIPIIASGLAVTYLIGHEHWRPVPVASLTSLAPGTP